MIETWGFYLFHPLYDKSERKDAIQASFDTYLDMWTTCEQWGFEGLAWAEHHFNTDILAPSPHLLAAAVAARTKRLRLTMLGSVLSLHDGRRFAEECSMLDYISNGRFEPGIAPGAGPAESVMAGIPAEEVRPRYYSAAELLGKAMAGPRVTHRNEFSNLDNIEISPSFRSHPNRSVWVTVMSPDSATWTAERGYKMCTSWMPAAATAALAEGYYAAADAAGKRVDPTMLGIRRRVLVAETDSQAQEIAEQSVDLITLLAKSGGFELADENIRKRFMHPDDVVVGSPKTVADRLIAQCQAGGYGTVMAFADYADMPLDALMRSHELIGTRVAPILKSAEVKAKTRRAAVAAS